MFADRQSCGCQHFQYVVGLQVEGDFQLAKHDIVVQLVLGGGLHTLSLASPLNDESLEESRQHRVAAFLEIGVVVFFQPCGDPIARDGSMRPCEHGDHFVVVQIKYVAQPAQTIIGFQGAYPAVSAGQRNAA